jgi:hypothetical protein
MATLQADGIGSGQLSGEIPFFKIDNSRRTGRSAKTALRTRLFINLN